MSYLDILEILSPVLCFFSNPYYITRYFILIYFKLLIHTNGSFLTNSGLRATCIDHVHKLSKTPSNNDYVLAMGPDTHNSRCEYRCIVHITQKGVVTTVHRILS